MSKAKPDLKRLAQEKLGFEDLRPEQKEAVDSLLSGRDTVVIQPTGSGKSAIYQAAGLLLNGSTIVVSPLIALQKDQVEAIADQPHDEEAVPVNSSLRTSEFREALERVASGEIEFIFLAPEQLRKPETLESLQGARPSLFVVDEAHCVSEWGHDFRPDYLNLGETIEKLGHPVVLAMTATAGESVRHDIMQHLHLRDPLVLVRGFDRPNIELRVDRFENENDKRDALVRRVSFAEKPGIIYTGTRKNAEDLVAALHEAGVEALLYHAGLKKAERDQIQERFMSSSEAVMVATNAFGMGVDKPDIRFVYHYDISDSLDSYYQEIGRAGRDGEHAEAVLFYVPQNLALRRFQAGSGKLNEQQITQVAEVVMRSEETPSPADIADQIEGMSARKAANALNRLTGTGVNLEESDIAEVAKEAVAAQEELREARRQRLETMQQYAELSTCRREFLLRYFGDPFEGPCRKCDNEPRNEAAS